MKIREIERKYDLSWRTVRKVVDSVWPEPRKQLPPRPTALDPYKPVIDGMLQADLTRRANSGTRSRGSSAAWLRPIVDRLTWHHHRDRHRLLPPRQHPSPRRSRGQPGSAGSVGRFSSLRGSWSTTHRSAAGPATRRE